MTRTAEQIRRYNENLLTGESLAVLAMDFFEFSPAVTKILIATRTGVAPGAEDIIQVCEAIREGRRRFTEIMPKARDLYEVSAKHDFEEAGQ
jgi:hypothetical protein